MVTADLRVRPYEAADLEDVRSICFETGFMGEPIAWQFADRAVFCELFCDRHALDHPDTAWIADQDGRAVGYLLGNPDTRSPHTSGQDGGGPDGGGSGPGFDLDRFPADLHINLLPAARGHGLGHALMTAWLDRLAELGVPGVHLGTWGENTGAIAFFESVGFREVGERTANLFVLRDGTQATVAHFARAVS